MIILAAPGKLLISIRNASGHPVITVITGDEEVEVLTALQRHEPSWTKMGCDVQMTYLNSD